MTTIARRLLLLASAAAWVTPIPVLAQTKEPIKIGVVSEFAAIVGQAIAQGAQLAADEINAKGGINGRQVADHRLRRSLIRGGRGARVPARGAAGPRVGGDHHLHQ